MALSHQAAQNMFRHSVMLNMYETVFVIVHVSLHWLSPDHAYMHARNSVRVTSMDTLVL